MRAHMKPIYQLSSRGVEFPVSSRVSSLLRKSSSEMKPEEQKAIIYSICRTYASHSATKLDVAVM